jgi:riboflavin kinase/FMN adenylyltransferase
MQVYRDLDALPTWQNSVVTIGSYDGVHNGHRAIIAQMCAQAKLIGGESVLITFEPHPRLVLAHKPEKGTFHLLNSLEEKLKLLSTTGLDHVVVVPFDASFSSLSAEAYLRDFLFARFAPHTIYIGYDHRYGNDRSGDLATMRKFAEGLTQEKGRFTQIIEIPAQQIQDATVSSTRVRKAIEAGELELASTLLGTPYLFSGIVEHGDQIGRTIGYPTANLSTPDAHKLLPPDGIYACKVKVAGQTKIGMLYFGNRPTIAGAPKHRIEVHLVGFEGDIYGQNIDIYIEKRIRGDMKLDGLPALKAQIDADKTAILEFYAQSMNDTAIVILNYNTARHLETFLPSVKAHSPGARIIVADNGSPDQSVAYLREHHSDVELLDLKINTGFAGGYNNALAQVKAKYYVILNSDVEVTEGWLDAPLALLEKDPTVAIVQPKIKAYSKKTHFEYAGAAGGWMDALGYPFCRGRIFSHTEPDTGRHDTEQECFWAAGAAFFIRADLYHAFEGFDSDYFAHNEEIDLCWRIKRAGYRVVCTPASVVYHLGGGTLEYESPRKVFLNFRNSLFTLLKNAPVSFLLWAIPARLLLDGLAATRFLAKGQFRAILAILQAHFSFYGNFGTTMRKRNHIASIIERIKIGEPNLVGMTKFSMVWRFYIRGKKTFDPE